MSDRAALISSKWKVFIDGVEVPHQGFSVTFAKNNLSLGSIILEPDKILTDIRPQSVVSIWAKDRFPDDDIRYKSDVAEINNRYYLFWEGLVRGHSYSKSPTSRAFVLHVESLFAVWRRTRAFMIGIGAISKSSLLSGSVAINANEFSGQDVFSMAQFANTLTEPNAGYFSDRLASTVTYLSSFNALLRLQTDRYNLLGRISGIEDNIFEDLFGLFSTNLLTNGIQVLSDQVSVYDVLNHLQNYGFYSNVEISVPTPQKENKNPVKSFNTEDIYNYYTRFNQTQFVFVPEMYFVAPPPCNLIFPDMITSLSVDRDFYNEPTRVVVPNPFAETSRYAFHVAPPDILRRIPEDKRVGLTAGEVFAQSYSAIKLDTDGITSPYQSKLGPQIVNLFLTTSDIELEKGIVVKIDYYNFETLAAYARSGDQDIEDKVIEDTYKAFITATANYRIKLDQYTRGANIRMNGNRFLVPGFTAAVFDSDISYLGLVESHEFAVDALGAESSGVVLSKVRPINPLPVDTLEKLQKPLKQISAEYTSSIQTIKMLPTTSEKQIKNKEAETLKLRLAIADKVEEVLFDIQRVFDVPIAPHFLNPDLTNIAKLDSLYQNVLGCKKLYTSKYSPGKDLLNLSKTLNSGEDVPVLVELDSLVAHVLTVSTLNNIFKMFDSVNFQSNISSTGKSLVSWQDINEDRNSLGINTFEWAHRNFLNRRKLFMKDYLDQNDLYLSLQRSSLPRVFPFFVMIPNETVHDKEAWDDSIFSKLPNSDNDPIIEELRATASSFLKTRERQKPLITYARNHFGGRAFDGQ